MRLRVSYAEKMCRCIKITLICTDLLLFKHFMHYKNIKFVTSTFIDRSFVKNGRLIITGVHFCYQGAQYLQVLLLYKILIGAVCNL